MYIAEEITKFGWTNTYYVNYVEKENQESINWIVNPWLCTKRSLRIQDLFDMFPETWTKETAKKAYHFRKSWNKVAEKLY